jgi:hypothetical protein
VGRQAEPPCEAASLMPALASRSDLRLPVLIVLLALVGTAFFVMWPWLHPSPEEALEEFLTATDVAEDQLLCPLVRSGRAAVPFVLGRVRDPEMPRRRYALSFLGSGDYVEAVPTLVALVQESGEKDYVRADALAALFHIDEVKGRASARAYAARTDLLGHTARAVLQRELAPFRMSYWDALWCRHD